MEKNVKDTTTSFRKVCLFIRVSYSTHEIVCYLPLDGCMFGRVDGVDIVNGWREDSDPVVL